jgi:hypothetical protein
MEGRSWQWFSNYYEDGQNSVQAGPVPKVWAQQVQGVNGYIWLWPTATVTSPVNADAIWLPAPLVDDTTPEAIAQPWQDVVPYFAAYMALVQAQRLTDAQTLYGLYQRFMQSARLGVSPQWLSINFPTLGPLNSPIDVTATMAGQTGKPAQKAEGAL